MPASKREDKTDMRFWLPRITEAGLPVPKTKFVDMPAEAQEAIFAAFDGKDAGNMSPFIAELGSTAREIGWPVFLRTTHTSGKHNWEKTCFCAEPSNLAQHVMEIVMYSEMAGLMGLPWDAWAVREFLPTIPMGNCPQFGNMPLCREFRVFAADGKVLCWHPYWPMEALEQGRADAAELSMPELFERLSHIDAGGLGTVLNLAERASAACGGAWSVDILETKRGWFVTDMAEAHKSFHWADCKARAPIHAAA